MASMIKVVCNNKQCKTVFSARTADVKRGWGKFCSKSCKAIVQEKKTGQYSKFLRNSDSDAGMGCVEFGWDGHKNTF